MISTQNASLSENLKIINDERLEYLLTKLKSIALDDIGKDRLMNSIDTKFITQLNKLINHN